MVKNEADIIETFVRYHCEIVDAMIVVDHGSVDETPGILENLRREGLPLHLGREDAVSKDQGRVLTRAAKQAVSIHRADQVVPLDADEFLISPGTREVRAALETLEPPAGGYVCAPWVTYVPTAQDNPAELNVLKRVLHRRESEPTRFSKALIPGDLMRRHTAVLEYGSHRLRKHGRVWKRRHPYIETPELGLAHFPVRSPEQLFTKVVVGWLSHLARRDRRAGDDTHLHLLYQRFSRGWIPSPDELSAVAMGYAANGKASEIALVRDPVLPVRSWFDLRYTRNDPLAPMVVLTAASERLARVVAECTRDPLERAWRALRHKKRV